jgi:hypothetical protein
MVWRRKRRTKRGAKRRGNNNVPRLLAAHLRARPLPVQPSGVVATTTV